MDETRLLASALLPIGSRDSRPTSEVDESGLLLYRLAGALGLWVVTPRAIRRDTPNFFRERKSIYLVVMKRRISGAQQALSRGVF